MWEKNVHIIRIAYELFINIYLENNIIHVVSKDAARTLRLLYNEMTQVLLDFS